MALRGMPARPLLQSREYGVLKTKRLEKQVFEYRAANIRLRVDYIRQAETIRRLRLELREAQRRSKLYEDTIWRITGHDPRTAGDRDHRGRDHSDVAECGHCRSDAADRPGSAVE